MSTRWLVAALGFVCAAAASTPANAEDAYTTANVNMRAGPSTGFPSVGTLPAGVAVSVYGCTQSWTWCDASWSGLRGWVSADYLEALYDGRRTAVPEYGQQSGLPVVVFEFSSYWDRWYVDRPWYDERERWQREWQYGAEAVEPPRTYSREPAPVYTREPAPTYAREPARSYPRKYELRTSPGAAAPIPPGHMPPPGYCRQWDPDLPPGHQPPSYPC